MSLKPYKGFTVECDDCGTTLEGPDGYEALVDGDDLGLEISVHGWERWEDSKDRCPACMDRRLADPVFMGGLPDDEGTNR